MTALENMKARIEYKGGAAQIDRMNADKLKSLKKALLYSYQSATALLQNGKEFRCLINPDKLKKDYDDKLISIPFEDICLNTVPTEQTKTEKGIEKIDLKAGDVFTWKENGTDWIVYLQRYEETAYFRAEIRRCKYEVNIEGKKYKVYASGPSEESIDWKKASGIAWNNINYSLVMYITKNEETEQYFHRFSTIELNNKPWEIQAADSMSLDGVIVVALKEDYQNTIEKDVLEEEKTNIPPEEDDQEIYISGDNIVYPYDKKTYYIEGTGNGLWEISNSTKVKILAQDESSVKIEILTGRSGSFTLTYKREGQEDIVLPITIESL